jgi:hypothetical protein
VRSFESVFDPVVEDMLRMCEEFDGDDATEVLEIGGCPMNVMSMCRLREGVCYNDSIIGAMSEFFNQRSATMQGETDLRTFCVDPLYVSKNNGMGPLEIVRRKKWSAKDVLSGSLLLPQNLKASHWFLFEAAGFQGKIRVYDSIPDHVAKATLLEMLTRTAVLLKKIAAMEEVH